MNDDGLECVGNIRQISKPTSKERATKILEISGSKTFLSLVVSSIVTEGDPRGWCGGEGEVRQ